MVYRMFSFFQLESETHKYADLSKLIFMRVMFSIKFNQSFEKVDCIFKVFKVLFMLREDHGVVHNNFIPTFI